jgi:outer membrane protein TolC
MALREMRTGLFLFVVLVFAFPTTAAAGEQVLILTLEEAVARALTYNRHMQRSMLDLDSSTLGLEAAQDVFDVKVNPLSSINYTAAENAEQTVWRVGGEVAKRFPTGFDLSLEPSVEHSSDEYGAGVGFSLSVPLLRGLGSDVVLSNVYAREYTLRSTHFTVHRQRINTFLDTITIAYSLVRDQMLIALYRDQLAVLEGHLQLARIKEQAGFAGSMDVYRAEIRIKEVEDSLNLAAERMADTADRLNEHLALPLGRPVEIKAPLEYTLVEIAPDKAVTIALENRVEILQGRANVSESLRKVKVAKQNILPELNLEMSYRRRGQAGEFDEAFLFNEDVVSVGLSSSTDLARSAEKSAWMQSRIAAGRQQLHFEDTRQNIARQVRTVHNSLEKSRERIALRRQQMAQAFGKQKLARVKFQYDEADNFDLIESQVQLQRAKVNLMQDEVRYIVDGYRLRAAMGTLIEFDPKRVP